MVVLGKRKDQLEKELARHSSSPQMCARLSKEFLRLERILELYSERKRIMKEIEEWKELAEEEDADEVERTIAELKSRLEDVERELVFSLVPEDEMGARDVVMEIRAGAGGEEAALFAADLFRMYSRYAEKNGWSITVVDSSPTDLGGYKTLVFLVSGRGVYRKLKYESGVHRVQRIPVTESGGRIHTSTATVAVLPRMKEVEVRIDPKDLRIETFRASGHGGQHVNRTESAVRITHIPTGIVVTCQNERSQFQNKERALEVLRARLYDLLHRKEKEAVDARRRQQIGSGERSEKIRTYNFPQNRVTDHRINYTLYDLDRVMDGELDELIEKLTMHEIKEKLDITIKELLRSDER
ncbi:MAG: peptide chain release factor 1 [Thermotogae bacterium]|nr:peptide chain release factor 1 [Thermotogota bacterium]